MSAAGAAGDVAAIEDAAFCAVPAAEVSPIGGWLARVTPDVSAGRPNSVLARGDGPGGSLAERIDAVERFYAERGRPARFQMTPVSRPTDLDAALQARGYRTDRPARVCVADVGAVAGNVPRRGLGVIVSAAPDADWLSTWASALDVDPARQAGPQALWARIETATGFALVTGAGGDPAGVGMAVHDGPWVGVFNMATLPAARRRGVARAALGALARWGATLGARRLYLQVNAGSTGALALYAGAGLTPAYEYSYRVRELSTGG